jgi:arylsulfatase A-like enzyme
MRLWWRVTLSSAALLTLVDAALLQRKRAYFTGGFLSIDHIRTPLDAAGFLAASLLTDAAVAGLLAAVVLWACGRAGLTRRVTTLTMLLAALGPLWLADLVSYELLTYLGDAFDIRLMFDLVGRNPEEFVAVASKHVGKFLLVAAVGAVGVAALFWMLARWRRGGSPVIARVRWLRVLAAPAALVALALATVVLVRHTSDVVDNGVRRKPSARAVGLAADAISDLDRDGYGVLGRPADPAPFDKRIHPYATDRPGNGIDEDGVAGDLPPAPPTPAVTAGPPAARWPRRPDVVLIVLESFRADLLGATNANRPVTPVLNALAARGVSARHAFSHNGYTAQSRHHIFSGALSPRPDGTTLIDDFKAQGYETAFFSGQDETFGGPALGVGFDRADVAFDARADLAHRYTEFTTPGSLGLDFDRLTGHVERFLGRRSAETPLFLYVNFYDTHFPYHHRGMAPLVNDVVVAQGDIGPGRVDGLRDMYANAAANVDRAVGRLLERVTSALGREPAVIVLADHGESLFDEGFLGHGYTLNDVQTRIPLIAVNLPVSFEEPVGQADLRPVLLAALQGSAAAPPRVTPSPGRAVFQYLGNIERPAQIGLVTLAGRTVFDFRSNLVRMRDGGWQRPDTLDANDRAAWLDLVRMWERLLLDARP